jgi:hypothetical protein
MAACNRVQQAVERTVPFGFLIQSLLICWYTRWADAPAGIRHRASSGPARTNRHGTLDLRHRRRLTQKHEG